MRCVNCEKEFEDNLEQCPYCGCHYPEKPKSPQKQLVNPNNIDNTAAEKQVKQLIDTAVSKGSVTDKERVVILRTAKENNLDPDVVEIMLDAALAKVYKKIAIIQEDSTKEIQQEPIVATTDLLDSTEELVDVPEELLTSNTDNEECKEVQEERISFNRSVLFCRKCGSKLSEGAFFCKSCGNKI